MSFLDLAGAYGDPVPPWVRKREEIIRMHYSHPYARPTPMMYTKKLIYPRNNKKRRRNNSRMGSFGSETKFKDAEVQSTILATTWQTVNPSEAALDSLSSVAQGTTESEHLGRTMYMISLHLRGEFFLPAIESSGSPSSDVTIRFAIVKDSDTKGTEVTATDVFDAGQTTDRFAFRNLQHTSRLRVYFERTFVIKPYNMNEGASNLYAHGVAVKHWKVNLNFKKPIRVLFSDPSARVSSIVDNSFHFVVISSSSAASVAYQVRLRFKDTI